MEDWEAQRIRDEEHLNMLGIFNFVMAGLALLGTLAFVPHLVILESGFFDKVFERGARRVERQAEQYEERHGEEFPAEVDRVTAEFIEKGMKVFLLTFMAVSFLAGLLCLLSGLGLRGRRWRTLSFVVAVLQCLAMPVGTVLGVFTMVVLSRGSVRELYLEAADPDAGLREEF